jgi:replicative DNA helicase
MQPFTNTRRFRLKILARLLDIRWFTRYKGLILPDYFEREDEHMFAQAVHDYHAAYKHLPSDADDIVASLGVDHKDMVYSVFLGRNEWDLEFASDMAVQFARQQAAKSAVLESLKDIENGELDTVVERLKEASAVGRDIENLGIDVVDDVDIWLADAVEGDRVPTGIIHLDIAMEGGLGRGEVGFVLAPPNYGKSMALISIGYGAAGLISRRNVAHFTLEMNEEVVGKRYAARQVFRFPKRGEDTAPYKEEFLSVARMMMPGKVRAMKVSGTVNDLRSKLDALIDTGFVPGLIIVDYLDEMDPVRHRNSAYEELGDITKDLRQLGYDYNCPVWTATQTQRSALNKEVITMADIADSFKKAAKADAIIALCQTREEEANNQCRLFVAKLRDGKSRAMIHAKYYSEQQAIISTGFVKRSEGTTVKL